MDELGALVRALHKYLDELNCPCHYGEMGFIYCTRHGALFNTVYHGEVIDGKIIYETNRYIHVLEVSSDKMVLTLTHRYLPHSLRFTFRNHGCPSSYYFAVKLLRLFGKHP